MKKIFTFLLAILIIFSLASCKKSKQEITAPPENDSVIYEEIGSGKNRFYLEIVFDEKEKNYLILTDESTVGSALEKLEIISGEQGDYGMYITAVEGEEHRYEKGGKYWAFYEDGQYASKSVDLTTIKNDKVYSLKVE